VTARAASLAFVGLGSAVAVAAIWRPEPEPARGLETRPAAFEEAASGPTRFLGADPEREGGRRPRVFTADRRSRPRPRP